MSSTETKDRLDRIEIAWASPTCTARPWRSCSRPDGQPLRHWVRPSRWRNEGAACSPDPVAAAVTDFDATQKPIRLTSLAILADGSLSIRGPREVVTPMTRVGGPCRLAECTLNSAGACGASTRAPCPVDA